MSIDNIRIPASLYPSLFKKNLVNLRTDHRDGASDKKELKIDFLGGNEKKIAFIVNNEYQKFLGDKELKFLSGLITACNITMADIAVVNFAQNKYVTYNDLSVQLASQKVLCFGINAANLDLPFTIPYFQVQVFQEVKYIFCPGLEELQKDNNSKKQLWASLQKNFNISK